MPASRSHRLMFRALVVCSCLTILTAYLHGRFIFPFPIPPAFLPGSLMLVAGLRFISFPLSHKANFPNLWHRFLFAMFCWITVLLPSLSGDGYFEIGQRAHIKSCFDQSLIDEIRSSVQSLSSRKDQFGCVNLTAADLPTQVGESAWGFPGHATCQFDATDHISSIELVWGGPLIGHHGLIITEHQFPFQGYPGLWTDDNGKTIEEYSQRYHPYLGGSYIMIDDT